MDATEAKNLIELLAGRSAAWSSLWTMFYTIAAAVVGVVASGKLLGNRRTVASAIAALGFALFAVGNYQAFSDMRLQREAVSAFVMKKAEEKHSPEMVALVKASAPPTEGELRAYHWGLTLFVLSLILLMPRFLPPQKE
jgi:3-oxoacyl-ACP reductase-like protein